MLQILWFLFIFVFGIGLSFYFFGGDDQEKK